MSDSSKDAPRTEEGSVRRAKEPGDPAADRKARRRVKSARRLAAMRSGIASVVWMVAVLAALVLSIGALCIALEMNRDNAVIVAILDTAHRIDFGEFKTFKGSNVSGSTAETRWALVNWGLAAVIWLVAGKLLDKLIRP